MDMDMVADVLFNREDGPDSEMAFDIACSLFDKVQSLTAELEGLNEEHDEWRGILMHHDLI